MKNKHSSTPFKRITKILPWVLTFIFFCSTILIAYKSDYLYKVLLHLGISEERVNNNYTLQSWERSLDQLNIDSDIVFFGDSITSGCDYQSYFPNENIVNLGLSGDTIVQMTSRTTMIKTVSPEKIFIMAGVNSLNKGVDKTIEQYCNMLSLISSENPNSQIYVLSTLPISKSKETGSLNNQNIITLNNAINEYCINNNITFINVHDAYYLDGYMNPELTKDGVHLKEEAYIYIIDIITDYIK